MTRDHIPFFSDLPDRAIKAARKLWDAAIVPSYNGMAAYHEFVDDLETLRMAPPPRAVVKRWVAGVQAGLIARPILADVETSAEAITLTYFDNLPDEALAALQAAWDKAERGQFTPRGIFESFCKDINAIEHAGPEWREFDAWMKAVKLGHVERPAKQIATSPTRDPNPIGKGKEERKARAAKTAQLPMVPVASDPEEFVPLSTKDFALPLIAPAASPERTTMLVTPLGHAEDAIAGPLRALRDQMVQETVSRLQADVQRTAEHLVAAQLRRMAAEMTGEAA